MESECKYSSHSMWHIGRCASAAAAAVARYAGATPAWHLSNWLYQLSAVNCCFVLLLFLFLRQHR